MELTRIIKSAFAVIGKEGSTDDGPDFIPRLWDDANGHFDEVAPLAKYNEHGRLAGVWGAMSDMNRTFAPWEDGFTRGLYLAGVECLDGAEAPDGWTKWFIPGYEYLTADPAVHPFPEVIAHLNAQGIPLAGAVHDFTDPATGKSAMYYPIGKLDA